MSGVVDAGFNYFHGHSIFRSCSNDKNNRACRYNREHFLVTRGYKHWERKITQRIEPMKFARSNKMGMGLEVMKFSLYIVVPIFATAYYNAPDKMRELLYKYRFVEYPPTSSDKGLDEEFQDMLKKQQEP